MKHKFFRISTFDATPAEAELNTFCAHHRITDIEKHFVAEGINSFWSICVTWSDNEGPLASSIRRKNKIDYKEVLSDDDFTLYSQLRDLRKTLAEREGTPPYNIFTNEQLASIVQQRVITKTALLGLEGVGQTRVDKYGDQILERMKAITQPDKSDETDKNNA